MLSIRVALLLVLLSYLSMVVVAQPEEHAILEIYSDKACTMNVTARMDVPGPFERRCQEVPGRRNYSHFHFCREEGENLRYIYAAWEPSNICEGMPMLNLTSFGARNSCAPADFTDGSGQHYSVFAQIRCYYGPPEVQATTTTTTTTKIVPQFTNKHVRLGKTPRMITPVQPVDHITETIGQFNRLPKKL